MQKPYRLEWYRTHDLDFAKALEAAACGTMPNLQLREEVDCCPHAAIIERVPDGGTIRVDQPWGPVEHSPNSAAYVGEEPTFVSVSSGPRYIASYRLRTPCIVWVRQARLAIANPFDGLRRKYGGQPLSIVVCATDEQIVQAKDTNDREWAAYRRELLEEDREAKQNHPIEVHGSPNCRLWDYHDVERFRRVSAVPWYEAARAGDGRTWTPLV